MESIVGVMMRPYFTPLQMINGSVSDPLQRMLHASVYTFTKQTDKICVGLHQLGDIT